MAKAPRLRADQGDQRREAAIAWNEAVGEDGHQPLSGAGNDAAAGDAAGVAAEAHGHGEALPPAGARRPEAPIHAEGHSGQITKICTGFGNSDLAS